VGPITLEVDAARASPPAVALPIVTVASAPAAMHVVDPAPESRAERTHLQGSSQVDPAVLIADSSREDLAAAREAYLAGEPAPAGVRPMVLASWERSRSYGVDPRYLVPQPADPARLSEARGRERELLEAAGPFLQLTHETLAAQPHLVALSDREGLILRIERGPGIPDEALDRAGLFAGASWHERDIGCNGVGTSLATGTPVILIGPEHFQESYVGWTCIGVPLRDRGEIVGALDLSVPNEHTNIHTWGWVLSIARGIETSLARGVPREPVPADGLPELSGPFHAIRGVFDLLARQLALSPTHAEFLDAARAEVAGAEALVQATVSRLHESEERLRRIADSGMVGLLFWEIGGRITHANDRFLEMVGYDRDDLRTGAIDWRAMTPPEWEAVDAAALRELVASGATRPFEKEFFHRNGDRVPVLLSAATFSGTREQGVTIAVDLTERKRAEARQRLLADAGTRLGTSLDADTTLRSLARMTVPVLGDFSVVDVLDPDGAVRRVEAVHGDPEKEPLVQRLCAYPPDPERPDPVVQVLRSGHSLTSVLTDEAARETAWDEEHLRILLALGPRSSMTVPLVVRGRTLGALTVSRGGSRPPCSADDLAAAEALAGRAALALENAALYAEARRAVADRDRVLAVVSHDLRSPLNTVTMAGSLLLESIPEEKKQVQIGIIRRAAEQMTRLMEDLLEVARIEGGGLAVEPEPSRSSELVASAVEFLTPLAESRSVMLRTDAAAEIPVRADRARILQVFTNLIANAVDHTAEGGTVTVGCEASAPAEARFRVEDTGVGILPEHLPHVFDRFWQADRSGRAGAGLGLAIAKGIVDAHGGRIWVESTPGKGTTFFFTLRVPDRG
jgi:PAS domain S-box-containing protein